MLRVSAYPTVEWLRSRACDRGAIRSIQGKRIPHSFSSRMASRLKEVLHESVDVEENVWISTPNGESEIRIVLTNGSKRIGIQVSSVYSNGEKEEDAVNLVYGRFEALYRIQSGSALHDAVYAIMCDRPTWFSNYGRLTVGRYASESIIMEANSTQEHSASWIATEHISINRMRLCKANDWVASFERALDVKQQFPAA